MRGIKKLKSGRWQARYFAGFDSKGKRIYPSKSFLLQADAIKWRRDRIHEKESGQPVDSLELTVNQYLDRWLENKKEQTRSNTGDTRTKSCRLYIRPTFGKHRLRSLTPLDIQRWQTQLLKRVSARTVMDTRSMFSTALNNAVKLKLIPFNPMQLTDAPTVDSREMNTLTREQARTFLDACPQDRWGLAFTTMLMIGLRPSEVGALTWKASEQGRIKVLKSLTNRGVNGWKFQPPKTSRSRREIEMPASLITKFAEHRKTQLLERMRAGSAYENHDLVFANPGGGPLMPNALRLHFKQVVKKAGLPDIRMYDLRHSFCTLSIAAGIDLKTVSSDMGHASVAFTLDTYGHVLESMRKGAAQAREELFSNQSAARGLK